MASHYDVLGLSPAASYEDIRDAFRRKAHSAHPDKGGSAEEFVRLRDAFDTLNDPYRRGAYDAMLWRDTASVPQDSRTMSGSNAAVADFHTPTLLDRYAGQRSRYLSMTAFVVAGAVCFVYGDVHPAYNVWLVLLGWVFMGMAGLMRTDKKMPRHVR